ncbi:MAG: HU family DNA-binding protein [Chlamydiia bacterium]|nr:HU family DNA-binding protein [Chlamydiia bacterium]
MLQKKTVSKNDLVCQIARKHKLTTVQVRTIVNSFIDEMTETLIEGNRIEFRDFGVFEVVRRGRKIGRNPKDTRVVIEIPSQLAVKFTPGKRLKEGLPTIDALAETGDEDEVEVGPDA